MTREKFQEWMEKIINAYQMIDEIAECKWFSDDLIEVLGQTIDVSTAFLQEEMGDSDWIPYWIWETDCGKNANNVEDQNGKHIPLKTIDDLYNIIEEEKHGENGIQPED